MTKGSARWQKFWQAWVRSIRRSSCSSARPATWRGASSGRACSIWRPPASSPAAGSSASRSTTSTPTAFAHGRARRARRVLHAQGRPRRLGCLCREPRLRAAGGGRRRPQGGGRQARSRRFGGESRRLHYLSVPPERGAVGGAPARRGRSRRALAHHHGKAVRHRPRERGVAERQAARGVRRGADLPHRPLPRQGAGAEHPRVPLRQRPVRADLEPQLHRPRADRRAGDAGPRQARRRSTSRPARFATWW